MTSIELRTGYSHLNLTNLLFFFQEIVKLQFFLTKTCSFVVILILSKTLIHQIFMYRIFNCLKGNKLKLQFRI